MHCGRAVPDGKLTPKSKEAVPPEKEMRFQVSKHSPAYYLTAVAKDRLPVFRTETIASIVCNAISESRSKHGFLLFAYVIMLDHLHLVTDSKFKPSEIQRLVN